MARPSITQDDRRKLGMMHGSVSTPANYRDASGAPRWQNTPTLISIPSSTERLQTAPKQPGSKYMRANGNPYTFNNTRSTNVSASRPGNPNSHKTLLSMFPNDSGSEEFRESKRQKINYTTSGTVYGINGSSSSHARGISQPNNTSEPEIQEVDPRYSVSDDAEIVILSGHPEDVGEPVSRTRTKGSSSPDPISMFPPKPSQPPKRLHDFETHPKARLSVSSKGKGRAKSPEVVAGSEEDDEIEDFEYPSSKGRPSDIPPNIVKDRRHIYEKLPEPAAVRRPVRMNVPSIHLLDHQPNSVVSRMKRKEKLASRVQGDASTWDHVGTSSSNFTNSAREKEGIFCFPLQAWCFGHHHIRHSEDDPLELHYERNLKRLRVVSGGHREVKFKLDRDVDSVKIVDDADEPLKSNVVIQFTTVMGNDWKKYQGILHGFEAGGSRHTGDLTFLFSTEKERGFSITRYRGFTTLIKKEFASTAVENIRPNAGKACWELAYRYAEMYEAQNPDGRDENAEGYLLSQTHDMTFSVESPRPNSKSWNGDIGPLPLRRSTRQFANLQTLERSPPRLPPPPSEPDELVLMYPPTGTGALSIMGSDLKRLEPEEYLNDTIIEFGLKLWLNDLREKDPALADQIHVFSSFFYKKLNNRKNSDEGYRSVRKWTSKVALFSKKYVIVPINENIHWYLAIIYEPGHTLESPLPPLPHSTRMTRKRKQEQPKADSETPLLAESTEVLPEELNLDKAETEADLSSITATCASTPHIMENAEMASVPIPAFDTSCSISVSDPVSATTSKDQTRDSPLPDLLIPDSDIMEIDVDDSVVELPQMSEREEIPEPSALKSSSAIPVSRFYASASNKIEPINAPVVATEDSEDQQQEAEVDDMLALPQSAGPDSIPQTYIFTLDSLGTRHPQAIKVLKNYLRQEAKDKHNVNKVREAIGRQVQVPVQPNTWDCGIYLLHFVKVFMNSPEEFVEQILSTRSTISSSERKKRWQDHEIPVVRDNLVARISELSEKWKAIREEEAKKRDTEDLSSEGEVDIVHYAGEAANGKIIGRKRRVPSGEDGMVIEEVTGGKAAPITKEKRHTTRLRG